MKGKYRTKGDNFCSLVHLCHLCKNKFTKFPLIPPQSLVGRLKENLEKLTEERNQRIAAENREKDQNKRMQRQIRDMKEEMGELSKKESEASRKKHELVRLAFRVAGGLDTIHWSLHWKR